MPRMTVCIFTIVFVAAVWATAAMAITEAQIVSAVRDFEGDQNLSVTAYAEDACSFPLGLGTSSFAAYAADAAFDTSRTESYMVAEYPSPHVQSVFYVDGYSGSSITEAQAESLALQFAQAHRSGFNQYEWESSTGYQAGDYRVTFYRELANGAITDVGGCTVLVALATGDIAGYVCHEGALGQGAESSPTLSAQDAIDAAVDEYEDLDGKTPTENVLVATADGQLVYQLRFEDQTEAEIEAGLPVTVAVDANSGDIVFVDRLASEPAPNTKESSRPAKGKDRPPLRMTYSSYYLGRCIEGPGQVLDLYVATPLDLFFKLTEGMSIGQVLLLVGACLCLVGFGLIRLNRWLVGHRRPSSTRAPEAS